MARHTRPLTNSEVKSARATEKSVVFYDGEGLELLVKPGSDSKLWRFRYYRPETKKRAMMGFGSYPAVSLAEARRQKEEARALLAQDIDPQEHRQEQRTVRSEVRKNTFIRVAADWFALKSTQGLAEDTLKNIWRSLERNVFPSLGERPITALTARAFIEALNPLAARGKADTVRRMAQRINEIMDYAVNVGLIPANPAARINRAFSSPVVRNMPTIRPEELPALMRELSVARVEMQTRLVIEWQLLVICRPKEAAGTRWEEIDFEAKEWRIIRRQLL